MKTRAKVKNVKEPPDVRGLRAEFGLSQATMARLLDVSLRTLATLEAGQEGRPLPRNVQVVRRLLGGLSEVIRPKYLRNWLDEPNEEFAGLKPLEVIERGEVDRIWEMIYRVGSGEPA